MNISTGSAGSNSKTNPRENSGQFQDVSQGYPDPLVQSVQFGADSRSKQAPTSVK